MSTTTNTIVRRGTFISRIQTCTINQLKTTSVFFAGFQYNVLRSFTIEEKKKINENIIYNEYGEGVVKNKIVLLNIHKSRCTDRGKFRNEIHFYFPYALNSFSFFHEKDHCTTVICRIFEAEILLALVQTQLNPIPPQYNVLCLAGYIFVLFFFFIRALKNITYGPVCAPRPGMFEQ